MGYGVGFDGHRWVGYMVPAECDMADCHEKIYRGLDWKCETHYSYDENDVEIEDEGCGLFFCDKHKYREELHDKATEKGESPEWMWWIAAAPSWAKWRQENENLFMVYLNDLGASDWRPSQENYADLWAEIQELDHA